MTTCTDRQGLATLLTVYNSFSTEGTPVPTDTFDFPRRESQMLQQLKPHGNPQGFRRAFIMSLHTLRAPAQPQNSLSLLLAACPAQHQHCPQKSPLSYMAQRLQPGADATWDLTSPSTCTDLKLEIAFPPKIATSALCCNGIGQKAGLCLHQPQDY